MEDPAEGTPAKAPARFVVLGYLCMVVWIAGACALFLGETWLGLMANDSGRASHAAHATSMVLFLGGQLINIVAGIPAGRAIYSAGKRKALWGKFFGMLGAGVLLQFTGVFVLVVLGGA